MLAALRPQRSSFVGAAAIVVVVAIVVAVAVVRAGRDDTSPSSEAPTQAVTGPTISDHLVIDLPLASITRVHIGSGAPPLTGGPTTVGRVLRLDSALTNGRAADATVLTYGTDSQPVHVASIAVASNGLAGAALVFGPGAATIVHGRPALVIETRVHGIVVAWFEGGRLLVVAGRGRGSAELQQLAESTRPASSREWTAIVALADPGAVRPPTDQVPFGAGTTPDGDRWTTTITLDNPTLICVRVEPATSSPAAGTSCVYSTPLSPATHTVVHLPTGLKFVVAIAPAESATVLRVTAADGTVVEWPTRPVNDSTAAVAASLPPGAWYELVEAGSGA